MTKKTTIANHRSLKINNNVRHAAKKLTAKSHGWSLPESTKK
jgi:hypothetical protein